MTLRDIRVRKQLHQLDRVRSSYPTVARTGDITRRGNLRIFDDTNTVIFQANATVTYPTTLPVGSKHLSHDLTSSISAVGRVNPGAIEPWIPAPYEGAPFSPFKEENLFEQARTVISSSFYQTGTAIADAGEGFLSSLGSKTIIRLELPLTGVSTLSPLSASSYYYDFKTKKFEQVQIHPGDTLGYSFGDNDTSLGSGNTARPPLTRENMLFNWLGKHTTNLAVGGSFFYASVNPSAKPDFFFNTTATDNFSVAATDAAVTQTLSLDGIINQPFLLEKCVINIPFNAGPGWFRDKTHISWTDWNDISPLWGLDMGGPALTLAIFNQFPGSKKDLILSATIIPENDNIRQLTEVQSFWNNTAGETTPYASNYYPQGFKSFSEPTVVVKQPASGYLTGSLNIQVEPMTSIGITAMESYGPYSFPATQGASSLIPFVQTLAGRNKTGGIDNLTGRSIFGRMTMMPDIGAIRQINPDLYIASGVNTTDGTVERFYQIETHTKSPYLLMPKDKLFFSLSKWRSAFVSASYAEDPTYVDKGHGVPWYDDGSGTPLWMFQSASHDVAINSGTFTVTLYGSLIREGKETHNTLNSRLDTDQVHEAIGMEPITDDFDVFYVNEISGSYIDDFKVEATIPYLYAGNDPFDAGQDLSYGRRVTGSLFNGVVHSHNANIPPHLDRSWSAQFNFTNVRKLSEIRKSSRNLVLNSRELFWDCRLPDPKQVCEIANPSFRLQGADHSDGLSYYRVLYTGQTPSFGTSGQGIHDWMMTHPYEAKYSSVSYKFFNNLAGDSFRYKNPGLTAGDQPRFYRYENLNIEYGPTEEHPSYGSGRNIAGDVDFLGSGNVVGMGLSEFVKVFYGTGDGRSSIDNRYVKLRANYSYNSDRAFLGFGAELRGWRYGMVSGFPTYTMAVFRRNRYGQMRDMLEQRLDTKFYNDGELGPTVGALEAPVRVKFVDASGNVVQPYETQSSNLSFEVTSSIPYTDGLVRNRENPLALARINQTIVVI